MYDDGMSSEPTSQTATADFRLRLVVVFDKRRETLRQQTTKSQCKQAAIDRSLAWKTCLQVCQIVQTRIPLLLSHKVRFCVTCSVHHMQTSVPVV